MSRATVEAHKDHRRPQTFTVEVNDEAVTLSDHRPTGAEIKAAAIAAGVPIQPDFVLSRVLPNGTQRIVPDDRKVRLDHDDEFWAIPGDDNSGATQC